MDNKSKYKQAIDAHPFKQTDEQVTAEVSRIIEAHFEENNTKEVYKKLYSCIDLTTLSSTDTKEKVWNFTEAVNKLEDEHPELENVAAICVYPNMVNVVKDTLIANVSVASVAGGFPNSQTFAEVKIAETALALSDGANEIDIVNNLGMFFEEDYQGMCEEIEEIKETCRDAKLKVILETGALETAENIHAASILALYSNTDFIKTSTGKEYPGATPEAAYVMAKAIKAYYGKTGKMVGIKISGGVRSTETAVEYYTIVKEVLGEEWCNKELFRIGASGLANTLLEDITT